jgi:hypothetical protein
MFNIYCGLIQRCSSRLRTCRCRDGVQTICLEFNCCDCFKLELLTITYQIRRVSECYIHGHWNLYKLKDICDVQKNKTATAAAATMIVSKTCRYSAPSVTTAAVEPGCTSLVWLRGLPQKWHFEMRTLPLFEIINCSSELCHLHIFSEHLNSWILKIQSFNIVVVNDRYGSSDLFCLCYMRFSSMLISTMCLFISFTSVYRYQ